MFDCVKVSKTEWMLAVELVHTGVSLPVGEKRKSQTTSYVIMQRTMFGGILSILQKQSMSTSQKLSGMDPLSLLVHIPWKIYSSTMRKSTPLLMSSITQIQITFNSSYSATVVLISDLSFWMLVCNKLMLLQ